MNPPYSPFKERGHLKPEYFAAPQIWRFNTPDFYLFYYVLGALISVLLILFLLVVLASGNRSQPTAESELPMVVTSESPAERVEPSSAMTSELPASAEPSVVVSSSAEQSPFDSAEQQPSYALRAESFEKLRQDPALSPADRLQATAAYQKYQALSAKSQSRLERALDGIQKEYFSASIRQLTELVNEGEILGDVYLQARQELPKAHLKKIDYYLIQGSLTKARAALTEARTAGVGAEELEAYDQKIKALEKVGR